MDERARVSSTATTAAAIATKGRRGSATSRVRTALLGLVAGTALVGAAGAAAPAAQADAPLLSTFEVFSSTTQAGAHADVTTNFLVTDFINNQVDTLRFHLPTGLLGTVADFKKCRLSDFSLAGPFNGCAPETQVGTAMVPFNAGSKESPFPFDFPATVNLLDAGRGDTALLGVRLDGGIGTALIHIDVRPGDYGLDATIEGFQAPLAGSNLTLWGVPWDHWDPGTQAAFPRRMPFMANPARCGTADATTLEVNSYKKPTVWETYSASTPAQTGCELLKFEPKIWARAESQLTASPSGFEFGIDVPQNEDPDGLATPPIRNVTTTLPEGVSINPSLANGLEACTDEQLGKGSNERSSCPAASRIGTAEFVVPALTDPQVNGQVYVGQPLPGNRYRLFVEAYGSSLRAKLKGSVLADPTTGQLTATFENNPEAPVKSIKLSFKGGPRAALAMPDTCGRQDVTATIDSWTGLPKHSVNLLSQFDVTFDVAKTPCPPQAFAPTFAAGVSNPTAGSSSTFTLRAEKPDGHAPLDRVAVTLPPGLVANLKGNVGRRIGTATASAGVGPTPFSLSGPVVLEGPYGDAPFSMRVTVPAIAGPFDLGDVVVRQKVYVDPDDAHVTVVSDPLPTILEGIPIRLQQLDVRVDRPGFMLNPTSCDVKTIGGTLGAATGQSAAVSSRFQVGECAGLKYAPKLAMAVSGELKNGGHPQLVARLKPGKGEANQRKAQVTLPLNLALDPENAKALCEPADAAKNACPAGSIVGKASAISILDVPLEGPVYFVRGERRSASGKVIKTLPKLFIPLKGQGVTVNLHASSFVVDRKLQTTFDNLPDAPIEDFQLTINGGGNGILEVTNGDICKAKSTPKVGSLFVGQNGRQHRQTSTLGVGCGFGVVKTARRGNRVTVTAFGLSRGTLTVSGRGLGTGSRSVGAGTSVASLGVSLNAATKRAVQQGRTVRLKVKTTFDPSAEGQKTVAKTSRVTVKPAKK